ncbi:MAG: tetratricopeptide repeat protein, partial [Planctomycetes bacterium]|nr:tetratricopeptide repeat protein [Planctomycetota bacterium]
PETIRLKPNESLLHHEFLLYSPNWGFHFREPGDYTIQATFDYGISPTPRLALRSNRVKLSVVPAPGVNAIALERFNGHPQGKFAIGMSDAYAIADEFQTVITEWPDTPYAPWSYYFLGRAWQARPENDQHNRRMRGHSGVNEFLSQKAIATFEILLNDHPTFPFAAEAHYQIAKEMLRLGQRQRALRRIKKLIEQHPNLRLIRKVDQTIKNFENAGVMLTAVQLP